MKKIIYLLSIAMSLLFSSCEDWLDMPSETKFDSNTIFESVSKAEMAVVGCYPNTFNRELYYQFGMGTDECFSTEGTTNSKNQVANYVYSTSNSPKSTYNAMYAGIEYANVCIKNLKNMNSSSEEEQKKINMLLGESYAIRAMNYWNLVRFFGDVPYPTLPVADLDSFTSSRINRDSIMDGCVADLQKAIELLPWKSAGMVETVERFTKNSAYGILSRVALYAAGYSLRWDLETYAPSSVKLAQRADHGRIKELYGIAANACKAVIDRGENDLLYSYEKVFRDLLTSQYNNESMLEVGQYGSNVNKYSIGYTNGIFCHSSCVFKKSKPAMHALPTYWFDFDEGDTRRDVTICNYGITANSERQMNTYTSNTVGKFRAPWTTELGIAVNKRNINWPVLRYSDVLLMYAEALNEYNNGPNEAAIKAFEKVRTRGFGNDKTKIGTTPTDYNKFRKAIIQERKLEFGFESLRRTDLIRWGILYEKLTETKEKLIDMANHTGNYANIDVYRAYRLETATSFKDPVVAVSYKGYKSEPDETTKSELEDDGYTLLNMYSNDNLSFPQGLTGDEVWVSSLFRGLEKNKVEIFPLNSKIIDDNSGLTGQQHPLY